MSVAVPEPIITSSPEEAGLVGPGPHRALFLDRDGVINVNHGSVYTPEPADWVPGIIELVLSARPSGHALGVVTNQTGIAQGYYDEEQFRSYTRWVHARFEAEGAPLLATYYCRHHPEAGIGVWRVKCDCRKPRPGMLMAAIEDLAIDPASSCLIGDQDSDLQAGLAAGLSRVWKLELGRSLRQAWERLVVD